MDAWVTVLDRRIPYYHRVTQVDVHAIRIINNRWIRVPFVCEAPSDNSANHEGIAATIGRPRDDPRLVPCPDAEGVTTVPHHTSDVHTSGAKIRINHEPFWPTFTRTYTTCTSLELEKS